MILEVLEKSIWVLEKSWNLFLKMGTNPLSNCSTELHPKSISLVHTCSMAILLLAICKARSSSHNSLQMLNYSFTKQACICTGVKLRSIPLSIGWCYPYDSQLIADVFPPCSINTTSWQESLCFYHVEAIFVFAVFQLQCQIFMEKNTRWN